MKDLKQIKSTLQTKTAELSNLLQTFQSLQQDVDTYISETKSPQLCYVKGVINGQNNNDPVMVFSCNALDEFLATSDLPLPIKRYPPPPPTVIGRRPSTAPREYKRPLVCLNLPGEHDPRNPLGVVLGKSRAMPRNTRDTTGLPLSLFLLPIPWSLDF